MCVCCQDLPSHTLVFHRPSQSHEEAAAVSIVPRQYVCVACLWKSSPFSLLRARRGQRDLEREKRQLERDERRVQQDIKKAAKKGDMVWYLRSVWPNKWHTVAGDVAGVWQW